MARKPIRKKRRGFPWFEENVLGLPPKKEGEEMKDIGIFLFKEQIEINAGDNFCYFCSDESTKECSKDHPDWIEKNLRHSHMTPKARGGKERNEK